MSRSERIDFAVRSMEYIEYRHLSAHNGFITVPNNNATRVGVDTAFQLLPLAAIFEEVFYVHH